jgi:hypothetical protein
LGVLSLGLYENSVGVGEQTSAYAGYIASLRITPTRILELCTEGAAGKGAFGFFDALKRLEFVI